MKRVEPVPPPFGDRLLTLREAAEVLRLSPRTIREYVRRGEIYGRIIGGEWSFRRQELDAFLENAPRECDFGGKDNDGDQMMEHGKHRIRGGGGRFYGFRVNSAAYA